ncbi:bacterial Ig-like domain-containing protein [Enterococcus faecalis]|nr:bacterial Ig-like domain-containing protein [Enterococcus faecalis]MDN3182589.1 bacterial Ig-like domain-containing protein [Enterococcus faecalis]
MKKLLLLIICFICINQGIITFAESETVNKPSEAPMTIGAPKASKVKLKLKNVKVQAEVGHYVYADITVDELINEFGLPIPYNDLSELQINGEKRDLRTAILANKEAVYYIRVGYFSWQDMIYSNEAKIEVVERDFTQAKLRDNEIYVGEPWDIEDTFYTVTDSNGRRLTKEDVEYFEVNNNQYAKFPEEIVDTTKAGKYKLAIVIRNRKNEFITSNRVMLTVLDYTSLKLKDDELYEGEKWDLGRVFEKVTDKYGNPIKPEEVEWVWIDGQEKVKEIDTSKPGKHTVRIAIPNSQNKLDYSNEVTVTVKEDKTKAELKNDELYEGEKWDLGRVFKDVVDKDGNPIKPEEVEWVWIDGQEKVKEIDTSKPGKHTVRIAILNSQNKWIYSNEVTVTVKQTEPFTIKQVPYFDFEDHILESTNKSVVNKKEKPTIEVETPSINGKDWQLQVELSPFLNKKNEKNILKGVSLFIPKGELESDLETEEPDQFECKLESDGKASVIMRGTKTKGKGCWKNKLETKEITLSIPPENKTGDFEATLHWTLLDVPT